MQQKEKREESKVVFEDGENIRVLRGFIDNEDAYFIYLKRRDGNIRIAKSTVLKIEEWSSNDDIKSDKNELH